jgi:hypothetical protein
VMLALVEFAGISGTEDAPRRVKKAIFSLWSGGIATVSLMRIEIIPKC